MSTFNKKYKKISEEKRSLLCVGLDPDPERLPSGYSAEPAGTGEFLRTVIDATAEFAAAYKPNLAFFEAMGPSGLVVFQEILNTIRQRAPGSVIVADAKRSDLASTSRFYARTFFETYDCDAVTVNPYMGIDSVEPFTTSPEKGCFLLCLTSNPGALQFEKHGSPPLFEVVASEAVKLNDRTDNIGLVTGATRDAEDLKRLRSLAPDLPFLVPGIGAQGGDLRMVLETVGANCLINMSRSILYASNTKNGVHDGAAVAAAGVVETMRSLIF